MSVFQGLFKTVLYIQVLLKPVQTLIMYHVRAFQTQFQHYVWLDVRSWPYHLGHFFDK